MDPSSQANRQGEFLTLEDLRSSILLTNAEINELVHNHQKFVATIRRLNNEAKIKINSQKPREGLVYLAEAEKVLEYAASCGKNIDRNMIVCVLHSEACCYQKLWELEKCSNYLQALIFNVSSHLKTSTPSPRDVEDYIKTSVTLSSHLRERLYGKSFNHRIQLFKYHLQFCAINSQLRNHKGALVSGRRAIGIIKDFLHELHTLSVERNSIESNYGSTSFLPDQQPADAQLKSKILAGVKAIKDEPQIKRIADYQATARHYFRKWGVRKLEQTNEAIKQSLKNFSIGSIMQMKAMGFEESRQSTMDPQHIMEVVYEQKYHGDMLKIFTLPKVLHNVLLLTMGYFTIATELRLIANEKHKEDEEQKKNCQQFRQSEIYHLTAIIITCIYVPYDMLYMRHLLTSFSNHYTSNISGDNATHSIENEAVLMTKQFDSALVGDSKKINFAVTQVPTNMNVNINRSLALEFADSIRIGTGIPFVIQEERKNSKDARFKDLMSPSAQTNKKSQKSLYKNVNSTRSLKYKSRSQVHSETYNKIPNNFSTLIKEEPQKISSKKKMPEETQKKKTKAKSLQPKVKKSPSNSKNTKSRKLKQKQKQKQKQKESKEKKNEYYKQTKAPTGTQTQRAQFNSKEKQRKTHGWQKLSIGKSSKKLGTHHSKGIHGSTGGSSVGGNKDQKGTPLKKNLDRYYF